MLLGNAVVRGMIPVDMTYILKLVGEDLGQDDKGACVDSIYL